MKSTLRLSARRLARNAARYHLKDRRRTAKAGQSSTQYLSTSEWVSARKGPNPPGPKVKAVMSYQGVPEGTRQAEEAFSQVVAGVRDYSVVLLDRNGHVKTWNAGAETIKGYRAEEVIGRHFSIFYPQESVSSGWPAHELEVAASTGRFEDEGWRVRRDGSRFWTNVVLTALLDQDGNVRGFLQICRDLTDRKMEEEKLRLSEERFRLMVESVKDYAIFMLNPEGLVTTWNAGAERLKGYKPQEIIGQHFSRFYVQEAIERGWPQEELRHAAADGRFEDEGWRLRKDGSLFWANVVITALRDEAGQLVGFAKVTRDLSDRREAEEKARLFVQEETARRAAEEAAAERQRLVDELKQADERKDQFLATLAHELRNPLAPLRSGLEVLKLTGVDDEMFRDTREMMQRQLTHLVHLVDDLLDVSRVSRGKINLQLQRLTLKAIVDLALETSRPALEAAGHRLVLDYAEEPGWVEGDLNRLAQVISNLLNNAAKFTPPGGEIRVRGWGEPEKAWLEVADNGIGIPLEMQPSVFDMFTQVSRYQEHGQGGLGIGLSLVKLLTHLHRGSVEVHSDGTNRGTAFRIRLPRATAQRAEAAPTRVEESASGKLRVLVVDDNADAVNMLATLIRLLKQDVRKARDGEQAIREAEEFRPELILMDIGMPRLNGHEACRKIREQPWGEPIVMVALTGWGQAEDKALASESGFDLHFTKPIDSKELEKLIAELLRRKERNPPTSNRS